MKKKFFAIILAFAMLLTSLVSINDVSFAEDKAFEIYEDGNGTVLKRSNNVDDISTFDYKDGNAYTIKVLKDLEVPANGGHLKTITLNGNITIEGGDHKISGASEGTAGDRLIKIEAGSKVTIDGLILDGEDKYAGILCDNIKALNIINKTTISKCKGALGPAIYCEGDDFNFKMEGSTVDSCKASFSSGSSISSGIYLRSDGNNSLASIVNSKITNCTSVSDNYELTIHGALSLNGLKGATIRSSNLENNVIKLGEEVEGHGAAIYCMETPLDISESSINYNILQENKGFDAFGGAICVIRSSLNINRCDIIGNELSSIDNPANTNQGGALYIAGGPAIIKDSNILNNTCDGEGGAIYFESELIQNISPLESEAFTIENSTVKKNKAIYGGALYLHQALSKIKNTRLIANEAKGKNEAGAISGFGGAIVAIQVGEVSPLAPPQGHIWTLDIDGGEISDNYAELAGGAISLFKNSLMYEGWNYDSLTEEIKKSGKGLNINNNVIFSNNKTNIGYFNPPDDVEVYPKVYIHDSNSLKGKLIIEKDNKFKHVESVLNNYDIDYLGNGWIFYDPNGGSGDIFVDKNNEIEFEYDEDSYELKDVKQRHVIAKTLAETKISNYRRFLGWNTEADGSGTKYTPGQRIDVKGNLTLFAQWEKPEARKVILTLDENYRNGKITNIEVEEGDLIEPHLYIPRRRGYIFRGWSYDQKHLDEVKPGDRIYTDTTLYAIWKRAEEEKVEEPEEIKGEDHKAYIFGYPNGSVRPNGSITRAEAAAMLARLLNIEAIGSAAKPQFTDTDSSWYNKAINAVVFRGIMKGYPDGRFRPNAPITRAEFTQMISTIDNKPYGVAPFADVPGHWAERAIGSEYQAKRITGYPDGLFRPDANITRAEAAVILNKIFERKYDNLSLLKCKNPQMIKRFTDLDESFWGWNDMVEATNTHEYVRRYKEDVLKRVEEDWLLIK